MKNNIYDEPKGQRFFIALPEFAHTAMNKIVLPRGRKKLRFELLRERYRLTPVQKMHHGGIRVVREKPGSFHRQILAPRD